MSTAVAWLLLTAVGASVAAFAVIVVAVGSRKATLIDRKEREP